MTGPRCGFPRLSRLVVQVAVVILIAATLVSAGRTETVARCGDGWLERVAGYAVLHLKGTPYEMGYQHGALLKKDCRENLQYLLDGMKKHQIEFGPLKLSPRVAVRTIVKMQRKYMPAKYFSELDGLAAATGFSADDVYAGNFIPELFHCSGFAVMNKATQDGTLYHGRVLDYAIDWRLQEHCVLVVAKPDGGIPFVNVTYAGFVGSVTGMNARHVSIGEMGGKGLGHWEGVPMAFLVREVLETATSVEEAIAVFRDHPRTCEYYYVVADGKTNRAAGMATSWRDVQVIRPGEAHEKLPHPVPDAVLMSAGERYEELVRRVRASHGRIDAQAAIALMARPVAMKSNLHNVLFAPASTKFWVANATADGQPAAEQPYQAFQLSELLARKPDASTPAIPLPARTRVAANVGP